LSACIKENLKCILVLEERVPGSYHADASGNNYLFQLLGAEQIHVVGLGEAPQKCEEIAKNLMESEGRVVYNIPGGASNEIGALGYCACASEIQVRRVVDVVDRQIISCFLTYVILYCCDRTKSSRTTIFLPWIIW
jgi:D-cysteine desulfhydrase